MNLATAFTNCAEKHAGKVAIFWGEREISYAKPRVCKISSV